MLLVGDDWAEGHHDVELMDEAGRTLARARLPEGAGGMARLHAMIGEQLGDDAEAAEVWVGIETDRGLWVTALAAAGYVVYGISPLQVARYRERHGVSGAKSDTADAHILADMVRTDGHQLRPVAGDSPGAQAVKVVARAHKTLIWERTRQVQRLRHTLRDYFPAALEAFEDLDAPDALELLARAPGPVSAARLSTAQVSAALKRARRRDIKDKTTAIRAALRSPQLAQPPEVTAACAAVVRALAAVITALSEQIKAMEGQVAAYFRRHPDAEIILSQPGLGPILAPGCSASSVTARTAMPALKPARTTRPPARSPASPGSGKPSWLATCTTTGSAMPSTARPSPPSPPHPAPAPTTTSCEPAAPATAPRCASSPTGSSASCTAA
jgi:transposase